MTNPRLSALISPAGLSGLLGSAHLLLVDCRFDLARPDWGSGAHAAGHIPGAVFAAMEHDLAAPRTAGTGRHPLPTPQQFAATLGSWGFTESSRVVIYDQGAGAAAARLWWMLRARGHAAVQVLDGGWAAWLAAGGAVETAPPRVTPTQVEPREFQGQVDAAGLQRELDGGSIALIDARAAERFEGRSENVDPVAGHVPGALNHPYTDNLGGDQKWLGPEALRDRWRQTLARTGGRPVVMMCGSGITACHNLLALEMAGLDGARLYAGSWSDWITDPSRPVATGG